MLNTDAMDINDDKKRKKDLQGTQEEGGQSSPYVLSKVKRHWTLFLPQAMGSSYCTHESTHGLMNDNSTMGMRFMHIAISYTENLMQIFLATGFVFPLFFSFLPIC